MSIDLDIFIENPIPIELFLAAARNELFALAPSLIGDITICEYKDHARRALKATHIGDFGPLLMILLNDEHDVLVLAISPDDYDPTDKRILINFSVERGGGDPYKMLLASACAISVARLANGYVNGKTPDEYFDYAKEREYHLFHS